MWHEITNCNEAESFMEKVAFFHDSCIKEIKYISGSYVNNNLDMYPINDQRKVSFLIQRQYDSLSMIELEFIGVKYFYLKPTTPGFSSEIFDATLIVNNNFVFWCDDGNVLENNIDKYDGTKIFASNVRWRSIEGFMQKEDFYVSKE